MWLVFCHKPIGIGGHQFWRAFEDRSEATVFINSHIITGYDCYIVNAEQFKATSQG